MDKEKPWGRLPGESSAWFQKFEMYRLLGPDRSLLAAYKRWLREKTRKVGRKVPKSAPRTWTKSRDEWRWQERAEAWDGYLASLAAAEIEADRLRVLTSGYAQKHERIRALNALAVLLLEEVYTEDKRWSPDVKQIGSGEYAERIDIVRFNAGLIREFREALADVAAEMGERVKGVDLTTKGESLNVAYTDDERARAMVSLLAAFREELLQPGGNGHGTMDAPERATGGSGMVPGR